LLQCEDPSTVHHENYGLAESRCRVPWIAIGHDWL
jgi:hypothetical protein